MTDHVSRETPPAPPVARGVFGDALPLLEQYAERLAQAGVERGLIGPREVPRLWERHLLNCAAPLVWVPHGHRVCDVGSGAGLPGLVWAVARPDLEVTLVEPLLRRTTWLTEVAGDLGLENVEVVRERADALHGRRRFDTVTSRAVAALPVLAGWSMPLVDREGQLLALKGDRAVVEAGEVVDAARRFGASGPVVLATQVGAPVAITRSWEADVVEGCGSRSGAADVVPPETAGDELVQVVRMAWLPGSRLGWLAEADRRSGRRKRRRSRRESGAAQDDR